MNPPNPTTHDIVIKDGMVRLVPRPAPTNWLPSDVAEFREDMLSLAIGCNAKQELIDGLRESSGEELRNIADILIQRLNQELL